MKPTYYKSLFFPFCLSFFLLFLHISLPLSFLKAVEDNVSTDDDNVQNETQDSIKNIVKAPFSDEYSSSTITNKQSETNKKAQKEWEADDQTYFYKSTNNILSINQFSANYSNKRYRNAQESLSKSDAIMKKMTSDISLIQADIKKLERKYEKTKEPRFLKFKDGKKRSLLVKRTEARKKSLDLLYHAIKELDLIINNQFRTQSEFINLLSTVYRKWTKQQYAMRNLKECIPILENYIYLRGDSHSEKEYPVHSYLSQAYAYYEKELIHLYKTVGSIDSDKINYIQYKKNFHLLRSTELLYGTDSIQYKQVGLDFLN